METKGSNVPGKLESQVMRLLLLEGGKKIVWHPSKNEPEITGQPHLVALYTFTRGNRGFSYRGTAAWFRELQPRGRRKNSLKPVCRNSRKPSSTFILTPLPQLCRTPQQRTHVPQTDVNWDFSNSFCSRKPTLATAPLQQHSEFRVLFLS